MYTYTIDIYIYIYINIILHIHDYIYMCLFCLNTYNIVYIVVISNDILYITRNIDTIILLL